MMPRHVYVDSKDALLKINNNTFLFELPEAISCNHYHNMHVGLTQACIPISCYNVREGQSQIDILLKKDGETDVTLNIIIPEGNYSLTQMLTKFNELMLASLASTPMGNINLTWSSNSNKVTLQADASVTIQLLSSSTGLKLLGFSNKNHGGINNLVTSDSLVDIRNVLSLIIKSDIITSHVSTASRNAKIGILGKIPITVGNFESVLYETTTPHTVPIETRSIKAFTISIHDDEHNSIDLNSMHWSLTLCVFFTKENPNNPPVAIGATKYKFENDKSPATTILRDEIDVLHKKFKLGDVESRISEIDREKNIYL
mgnify:CR=1 FL=1